MLRIKNKRANIPNGYLYVQRETGWDSFKVMPHLVSDFYAVCQAIRNHRAANPQLKLNTNMAAIEAEVENVNVARIAAMPGARDVYLMDVGEGPSSSFMQAPVQTLQQVAAVGANLNTGRQILLEWEESGEPPASQELAYMRAAICVTCPQNGRGGLSRYFTVPAAEFIKRRFERLHQMNLKTPSDNQLGVCEACTCPLPLKVWTPLHLILKHITEDQKSKLDKACWITAEELYE